MQWKLSYICIRMSSTIINIILSGEPLAPLHGAAFSDEPLVRMSLSGAPLAEAIFQDEPFFTRGFIAR